MQRRHLAKAVATGHIGIQAKTVQHCQLAQARDADRRLCPVRGTQVLFEHLAFIVAKDGSRKHDLVQTAALFKLQLGGVIPDGLAFGKSRRQVAAHTHILAALPGEQKSDLAHLWRAALPE